MNHWLKYESEKNKASRKCHRNIFNDLNIAKDFLKKIYNTLNTMEKNNKLDFTSIILFLY